MPGTVPNFLLWHAWRLLSRSLPAASMPAYSRLYSRTATSSSVFTLKHQLQTHQPDTTLCCLNPVISCTCTWASGQGRLYRHCTKHALSHAFSLLLSLHGARRSPYSLHTATLDYSGLPATHSMALSSFSENQPSAPPSFLH